MGENLPQGSQSVGSFESMIFRLKTRLVGYGFLVPCRVIPIISRDLIRDPIILNVGYGQQSLGY